MQTRKSTEIRREQIVNIIRNIISSKGIQDVTINEIAIHMGTTKGAIYRHFKSKRDILNLLIKNIEETLMDVIDKSADNDPIQYLNNILLNQLTLAKNRRKTSLVVILGAMQFSDPSIKKKIAKTVEKYLCRIEEILSKAVQLKKVNSKINPKTSAIAFFGLIQSSITMWSYKKFNFVPKELHSQLWSIYHQGIDV
ncbi:transcriptional regulator [Candidatus Scalindua japonica]|uniref:Transcriptional regulator n=1 Tax=Candidatus Scalindua japonica TaxID=1284222 RepID=A0A286U041_9BACT|nr:TetR/AcrR family transcriptional regulator [Candidatus Scalindua japonica]GAX61519.1 transcriptional regulator [Candidatus Scalindua japonica]